MSLPVPKQKSSEIADFEPGLPSFEWIEVKERNRFGEGGFGDIYTGKFNGRTVVVKKMKRQTNQRERDMFLKEVHIPNGLKCKHIVQVEGFCANPLAVMLEYVYFDFQPLGIPGDRATSLAQYLNEICTEELVCHLARLQVKIAMDVCSAIAYLHTNDVVHRDIKPENILVSNTHYCHLTDSAQIEKAWQSEGIVSKLADFGESRSTINQTAAIHHTRTTNFERGTLVYNPPEMLTAEQGSLFLLEDLKHADLWSLGMVMFVLINPDLEYPYAIEMEQFNVSSVHEAKGLLHKLMSQRKKPTFSTKYNTHQSRTDWILINEAFKFLSSFQPFERCSAMEVLQYLETRSVNELLKTNSSVERINDKDSRLVSRTQDKGLY